MPRSILVPLDGSPEAERAVGLAARLARAGGATLNLVHVHTPATLDPISIAGMPVIDAELRSLAADHERTYLSRVAADVAGPDLTPVIARLEGPVVPTLVAHARAVQADLIVLTTHGRGGFAQLWLGSVADALVRNSVAPLLLLRPKTPIAAFESEPFRRIMVLLDGSALAESVLPHAQKLAIREGAELILLRAVDTLLAPNAMPYADIYRLDQATILRARTAAHTYLSAHAEQLRASGLTVHTQVCQGDEPWQAILTAAEANAVDLIAMATRGQGGIARMLLGSTADKILRSCTLPVLLIHPPEPPA
jgi:nucleotide-binding universal stress UspA family protein